MLVIIAGCGRIGSRIANILSDQGKDIIIIDTDENSFSSLSSDFAGFHIIGDVTQTEVLKSAKIESADLFLALTGDDNINLMASQIVKHYYRVPEAVARVSDPARKTLFEQMGIKTICPIILTSDAITKSIEEIEKQRK